MNNEVLLGAYIARREALLEQLRDVLIEDLRLPIPREQIEPDTPLFGTGLALDSIDAVDLIVGIERRTDIRINDNPSGRLGLRSINMVINYLFATTESAP